MNDALTCLYYILDKFLSWIFGSYFFSGVSIGMIFVGAFVFSVLLKFVIAIPKVNVGGRPRHEDDE